MVEPWLVRKQFCTVERELLRFYERFNWKAKEFKAGRLWWRLLKLSGKKEAAGGTEKHKWQETLPDGIQSMWSLSVEEEGGVEGDFWGLVGFFSGFLYNRKHKERTELDENNYLCLGFSLGNPDIVGAMLWSSNKSSEKRYGFMNDLDIFFRFL